MGINWKNLLTLALGVTGAAMWIAQAPANDETAFAMPSAKTYVNECGSCHTAYAPGMLPARSWHQMMNGLAHHFGEDAELDEPDHFAILKELESLAADGTYVTMRMRRINGLIPAGSTPQRITETGFFKYLHDEVPAHFWRRKSIGSPANCGACHPRANEGRYAEREIRIPPP